MSGLCQLEKQGTPVSPDKAEFVMDDLWFGSDSVGWGCSAVVEEGEQEGVIEAENRSS
jgi:hypothetical protein